MRSALIEWSILAQPDRLRIYPGPRNLAIGARYKLSKPGTTTLEYKVETMRQDDTEVRGWVSSTDLWGQELEVVKY